MPLGIGVGRNTHVLVILDGQGNLRQEFIPNSWEGVEAVRQAVESDGDRKVIFLGNHRWATPFVFALAASGIECLYQSIKQQRGSRGQIGDVGKMVGKIITDGVSPRPFFLEKTSKWPESREELPTTYRLALEYLEATDEVRTIKHRLLDTMAILFPEVVQAGKTEKRTKEGVISLPVPQPQPPDLFGKKMRPVLENPDPVGLETHPKVPAAVRELAKNSLGHHVPHDLRQKTFWNHRDFLREYDNLQELKESRLGQLKNAVAEHPLVIRYGGGDIITVLTGLLGWREWPNWRELRRFCGLDVSTLDSKGKPRISRVRPQIRQYLYLFGMLTKAGRELTKGTKGRVKRLERVLKHALWWGGLRPYRPGEIAER